MIRALQLITLLVVFAFSAAAEETLTWQQCVEMARVNNSNLRSAIASEKSFHYLNNAAVSGFLPQINGTLSSNRGNGGNSTNLAATTVQSSVTKAYTGSISLTQNIFSGFSDVGKFDQTKANDMVAKANVLIVKAQVSYDLKSAYGNFSYAKETLELLDRIIKRREDNLRIIQLRFKSGMENKGSLLLAEAYLESAKYDRLQASNLVESARAQLCKAIGVTQCKPFDITNSVPITSPPSGKIDFGIAVQETPQHLQAVAQEKASKAGITIAQSTFLPSLNLTATSGQRGTTMFPQNDYWLVGMNLSYAFFTGGKDYYSTRSAYALNSASKENLEVANQQALVTLKQGYNSYIESIAKLKVDSNFKEAAKLRADIARSKYNNGLLSFENWDIIETDLIARQKNYLQSKLNRVTNEALWEQAQGKGVFYND